MRAVVQRVSRASVAVDSSAIASIGAGLLVLLAVADRDNDAVARRLAARIAGLRVFADAAGRMNRSISAVDGEILVVSQFTLYGDVSRGHRPSFVKAGQPDHARRLCDHFVAALRDLGLTTSSGVFGAHMEVDLVNDGPVTLVLSSGEGAWEADAG